MELHFNCTGVNDIHEFYSEETDSPIMGDLIFFSDGTDSTPTHIAIFLQKKGETVFFIDASSREDTMKVLVRSYPETNPMILSYGRMLCRGMYSDKCITLRLADIFR